MEKISNQVNRAADGDSQKQLPSDHLMINGGISNKICIATTILQVTYLQIKYVTTRKELSDRCANSSLGNKQKQWKTVVVVQISKPNNLSK